MSIMHKWRKPGTMVNLPRRCRPTKMTPRAYVQPIQEVTKELRTTKKQTQKTQTNTHITKSCQKQNPLQAFVKIFCGLTRQMQKCWEDWSPIPSGVKYFHKKKPLCQRSNMMVVGLEIWSCFAASGPGLALTDEP